MTKIHPAFEAAETLAPTPTERGDATRENWIRHYAARAFAAHAAFRDALATVPPNPEKGSRPDLGYLMAIATSATAATCALTTRAFDVAETLFDLSPAGGALNGEYIFFLAETLDRHGINPADIDSEYGVVEFTSPSRIVDDLGTLPLPIEEVK